MAVRAAGILCAAVLGSSATADVIDAGAVLDACLLRSDQAFETALAIGEPLDSERALPFYRSASWSGQRCASLAMDLCEISDAILDCRLDLAQHSEEVAISIINRVPAVIETGSRSDRTYGRIVDDYFPEAFTSAGCNEANGGPSPPGMCDLAISFARLDLALQAWRMARRHGAMDLEGHPPMAREDVPWEN